MYNTIYPGYINQYRGVQNRIVKRKEDEEQSQSSAQSREQNENNYSSPNYTSQSSQNDSFTSNHQSQYSSVPNQNQFPNGQKVAIDYSKPSVNISQIITDFQNTTNAIAAPEDVSNEVNSYLSLIETQAQKDNPNKQIIQSNLKNASQVLDQYISESLNKPSKVVENWIDALFLQHVDYKADPKALNPEFQVQIPEKKQEAKSQELTTGQAAPVDESTLETVEAAQYQGQGQEQESDDTSQNHSGVYIPEDKQLRKMFIQAKKYAAIDQPAKALNVFKQTLDYAKNTDDTQAQAMVYYEVGQIYDKHDYLPEAVKSYNNAILNTQDNNIKARSHMSMAQIYDDVAEFEPAVDHSFAAISYAGEADNLNVQTKALTNLANIYCNRYDKENTSKFIDLATDIAKETSNDKVVGSTYRQAAGMSERLDENPTALECYKESTRYYTKAQADENVVKNYQSASSVMSKLGDNYKAKVLLQKAFIKGQDIDNPTLLSEITNQLAQF